VRVCARGWVRARACAIVVRNRRERCWFILARGATPSIAMYRTDAGCTTCAEQQDLLCKHRGATQCTPLQRGTPRGNIVHRACLLGMAHSVAKPAVL
jgi:hypothetical protein